MLQELIQTKNEYDDVSKVPSALYDIPTLQHYNTLVLECIEARGSTDYAAHVDNVLRFGQVGDLTNSENIHARKASKANPSIQQVVGHSIGGSVAVELPSNSLALASRTYAAHAFGE